MSFGGTCDFDADIRTPCRRYPWTREPYRVNVVLRDQLYSVSDRELRTSFSSSSIKLNSTTAPTPKQKHGTNCARHATVICANRVQLTSSTKRRATKTRSILPGNSLFSYQFVLTTDGNSYLARRLRRSPCNVKHVASVCHSLTSRCSGDSCPHEYTTSWNFYFRRAGESVGARGHNCFKLLSRYLALWA